MSTTSKIGSDLVEFIRDVYGSRGFIPLHAPAFNGNERKYVLDTIDSTFVSSVGPYVDQFESRMATFTGCARAVAVVNGTAALHVALVMSGVEPGDLVVTQPLTFVATCNAIHYCGATPIFVDVDLDTLGMSAKALEQWLSENARLVDGECRILDNSARRIRACLPMHTFGHPADLDGLVDVCNRWNLTLVEDAAESLGSFYKSRHTGTIGRFGTLSFNGNKVLTTGGGGMVLASAQDGAAAKHLTTTAKIPHPYKFLHDAPGYNYRMPNINAALGCAQLEQLDGILVSKRALASRYENFFSGSEFEFVKEPEGCKSNYWLNAIICADSVQREELLKSTNDKGVMTRPIWTLMHHLPMYASAPRGDTPNAEWLEERVVNLPSSLPPNELS